MLDHPKRRGSASRRRPLVVGWAALTALVVAAALLVVWQPWSSPSGLSEAEGPRPGRTWPSGAWTGGDQGTRRIESFGQWRGTPADTVLTYPDAQTWSGMADSNWHVWIYSGFQGRLVYGLPLLPKEGGGSLPEVAEGRHDDVWQSVAESLVRNGFGDSYLRIGLEANGTWAPWGATADTADDFVAAYRRVAAVVRETAPQVRLVFDISCGTPLEGSDERLGALTRLYPGDDVVDVVGCDTYDSYRSRASDQEEFDERVLRGDNSPGLLDVVEFARARGKRFAVPEWGLTSTGAHGSGDNPFYIRAMYDFFVSQADILEFENYFNEPHTDLRSSLWSSNLNPDAAQVYRRLW